MTTRSPCPHVSKRDHVAMQAPDNAQHLFRIRRGPSRLGHPRPHMPHSRVLVGASANVLLTAHLDAGTHLSLGGAKLWLIEGLYSAPRA